MNPKMNKYTPGQIIGYCIGKDDVTGNLVVSPCFDRPEHDGLLPSNFWDANGELGATRELAMALQRELHIARMAIAAAAHHIGEGSQTYAEANTIEGWIDVFTDFARTTYLANGVVSPDMIWVHANPAAIARNNEMDVTP